MGVGGEEFGPWLARQLSRMDISQAELAERVGLTRAAVSAWVNGRSEPRDDTKRLIADAFGTDEASLAARVTDVVTTLPLRWHHRRAHADGGRGGADVLGETAPLRVDRLVQGVCEFRGGVDSLLLHSEPKDVVCRVGQVDGHARKREVLVGLPEVVPAACLEK